MTRFKAFRRFNNPKLSQLAGLRARLEPGMLGHFPDDGLPDRVARALINRRAIPLKELFESFEFFERTRRRLRAPVMADLCCGHGLTGVLFALFERSVERVVLLDRHQPDSARAVLDAVAEVAPWVDAKVDWIETDVEQASLPQGTSVIALHACGVRTDRCLDAAIEARGAVAVMPCCYAQTGAGAPRALHKALGIVMATDIHRTYRLEAEGYQVDWSAIPEAITPMHRILIGIPTLDKPAAGQA